MSMVILDDEKTHQDHVSDNQIHVAIDRLYRRGSSYHLTQLLNKLKTADLADILNEFRPPEAKDLFVLIGDPRHAALVLEELDETHQTYILSYADVERVVAALEFIPSERRSLSIGKLDRKRAWQIRETLRQKSTSVGEEPPQYLPGTAGGLMSTRVFALSANSTVAEATATLQALPTHDMLFYLYVVDEQKRLVGVCSLRQLLLADPTKKLREIKKSRVSKVAVNLPQEEVAKKITRYHLLALPVVDLKGVLLGQITVVDVVQLIQDESTSAMLKLAGGGSKKSDLLAQSPFSIFRIRVPWLVTAFLGYIAISVILGGFEETLSTVVQLSFFFPIVIGMSGNSGTQTGTVAVRGLALGTLNSSHFFPLLRKEVAANIIQGTVYGGLLALAAYLIFHNPRLSMTVGPALMFNIIASSIIAMSLPFFFQKLKIDPAVAAGPLALTFIDLVGSTNYLIIAYFTFKP